MWQASASTHITFLKRTSNEGGYATDKVQDTLDAEEVRVAEQAHAAMGDRRTLQEIMLNIKAKQDEILHHIRGGATGPLGS